MNNEFIRNALNNGIVGKQWVDSIPSLIQQYEQRWNLRVLPPFHLSYNYVAPAIRIDGTLVVLKIGYPHDREFQTEVEALEVFNGEGIEKLLEEDKSRSVILIERVTPGVPLSSVADDDESTRILVRVMKKLWKPLPPGNTFIPISEWMRAIPQYQDRFKKSTGIIPMPLVDRAHELFDELIATSAQPVLVHGDLHHDNVLSSDRDEWLAIDPKGIAAEPAYETAAMIRNPYERLKKRKDLKDILRRRINILSEELGFDSQRILKWCFAQTVLSAVWNAESTKGVEHAVMVASVLNTLKI